MFKKINKLILISNKINKFKKIIYMIFISKKIKFKIKY